MASFASQTAAALVCTSLVLGTVPAIADTQWPAGMRGPVYETTMPDGTESCYIMLANAERPQASVSIHTYSYGHIGLAFFDERT